MIECINGDYACVGNFFYGDSLTWFCRLDSNLNILSFKKYSTPNVIQEWGYNLMELPNGGFIMSGDRQGTDYDIDGYIRLLDAQGNLIWDKEYGTPEYYEEINSVNYIDADTYLVTGGQASDIYTLPPMQSWAKSRAFTINKLGLVGWEWESELNTESGFGYMHTTDDGGWIYTSRTYLEINDNEWGGLVKVVHRDSAFNLVWSKTLSHFPKLPAYVFGMQPSPDGGWVVAGGWRAPGNPPWSQAASYHAACVYKISAEGDSLWARYDLPDWPDPNPVLDFDYSGLCVLPSGSIMLAGWVDRFEPGPPKSFGWLVKMDTHGCRDEGDCISDVGGGAPSKIDVSVYPNPATDYVIFEWPPQFTSGEKRLLISDITGNIVFQTTLDPGKTSFRWNTIQLSDGVYFWQMHWTNGNSINGKLLLLNR